MSVLPLEIIDLIAYHSPPYESLVLGRDPDPLQLLTGGGPGILLSQILDRDVDLRLLNRMKEYIPDADLPIYKAVLTKDERILRRVISVWGTRVSCIGKEKAVDIGFNFGIRNIYISDSPIDINTHYVSIGRLDMVDLSIDNPLMCVWGKENIARCYIDEKFRKHLGIEQKIEYLTFIGDVDEILSLQLDEQQLIDVGHELIAKGHGDKVNWVQPIVPSPSHTPDVHSSSTIWYDNCGLYEFRSQFERFGPPHTTIPIESRADDKPDDTLWFIQYYNKLQWVDHTAYIVRFHVSLPDMFYLVINGHGTTDLDMALATYYKQSINPSYGKLPSPPTEADW